MTLAQKAANRKTRIRNLADQICEVLRQKAAPLELSVIETYLKAELIRQGETYPRLNTFDVRDAVSELVTSGAVRYRLGSEVELVAE